MQVGEVLSGYRIITPPTNAGGGMSQWSFAERDGQEFFFKMFLAPKFPLEGSPGSAGAKARKRDTCLAFEERHLEIAQRLRRAAPGSGNLVIPLDFFRVDATYVKITNRVHAVTEPRVDQMEPRQRLVFLRSLSYSLQLLHEQHVVHGDLKPDNVLVQEAGPGLYAAMLIDFDEGYIIGKPPSAEFIVGDPSYYSPELLRYIKRDERLPDDALSTASDMFSFGLLLHWYLTGTSPGFDHGVAKYPAEALLMRQELDVSKAPAAMWELLSRLLDIVPSKRPSIAEVIAVLAVATPEQLSGSDITPVPPMKIEPASRLIASGSRLKISGPSAPDSGTGLDRKPTETSGSATIENPEVVGEFDPQSAPEFGLRNTMGRKKGRPKEGFSTETPDT